jgi:hypothetical protein
MFHLRAVARRFREGLFQTFLFFFPHTTTYVTWTICSAELGIRCFLKNQFAKLPCLIGGSRKVPFPRHAIGY